MNDIKSIYTAIVEQYKGFDLLSPLQKIEQQEKIDSFISNTFYQPKKLILQPSQAVIINITTQNIIAIGKYNAESGEGFEDGYIATYELLRVNYHIEFENKHYEIVRLLYIGNMIEFDGEIQSLKIRRLIEKTTSQNYWDSFIFDISLKLYSISAIKKKELKASLIGTKAPKNSSCFIATAAFGHNDKAEVIELRKYRDETLSKTRFGRLLIKLYEVSSPRIAAFIRSKPLFRTIVRFIIRAIILPRTRI